VRCTADFSSINADASSVNIDSIVRTANALRQDKRSITQASGVADNSIPPLPMAKTRPEIPAKRATGQCFDVNTIAAMNAGEQPIPIRIWPRNKEFMSGANVQIAPPNMTKPESAITARRTPNMSSTRPTGTCNQCKAPMKHAAEQGQGSGAGLLFLGNAVDRN